jgi:hypothetical protein
MATAAKKPPPPPVDDEVEKAIALSTPVETVPAVEPVVEVAFHYEPLTDDQARRVRIIKEHFQDTVKYLHVLRDAYHAQAILDDLDVAIMHTETASMWAVRAVTKVV